MTVCKSAFATMANQSSLCVSSRHDPLRSLIACSLRRDYSFELEEGESVMRLIWTSEPPSEELRERWDSLAFQMEKPEVFYTWEWAVAAARAYGHNLRPWIATGYEGDELVAVVELARSSSKDVVFL